MLLTYTRGGNDANDETPEENALLEKVHRIDESRERL